MTYLPYTCKSNLIKINMLANKNLSNLFYNYLQANDPDKIVNLFDSNLNLEINKLADYLKSVGYEIVYSQEGLVNYTFGGSYFSLRKTSLSEVLEECLKDLINQKKPNQLDVKITQDNKWIRALNVARKTAGLPSKPDTYEPSDTWKRMAIMAEHSPIKLVEYTISFKNLRTWCITHLVRHPFVLPFIKSQRSDRASIEEQYPVLTDILNIISDDIKESPDFNKRDYLPQGTPNDGDFVCNAQTIINISKKRLCRTASKETRQAWLFVKEAMKEVDPILADFMVPSCIYRGFCPEMKSCGYWQTSKFEKDLNDYRNLINRGKNNDEKEG